MPDLPVLPAFARHCCLAVGPGPNSAMIVANSVAHGKRCELLTLASQLIETSCSRTMFVGRGDMTTTRTQQRTRMRWDLTGVAACHGIGQPPRHRAAEDRISMPEQLHGILKSAGLRGRQGFQ